MFVEYLFQQDPLETFACQRQEEWLNSLQALRLTLFPHIALVNFEEIFEIQMVELAAQS